MDTTRQYGRDDVNYDTWYTDWMKQLAKKHTRAELETMLGIRSAEVKKAARSHLKAIERSGSNLQNSSRRASTWNATAVAYDYRVAIDGALEIYDLFPEHTLEQNCYNIAH